MSSCSSLCFFPYPFNFKSEHFTIAYMLTTSKSSFLIHEISETERDQEKFITSIK